MAQTSILPLLRVIGRYIAIAVLAFVIAVFLIKPKVLFGLFEYNLT